MVLEVERTQFGAHRTVRIILKRMKMSSSWKEITFPLALRPPENKDTLGSKEHNTFAQSHKEPYKYFLS